MIDTNYALPPGLRVISRVFLALALGYALAESAFADSPFAAPVGIYALGPAVDNAGTLEDERLSGLRDYDFVTGYTLRALWRDLEPTQGDYDFSVIDQAIQLAGAAGQRLNLEILDATPEYVLDDAATTYVDHKGNDRPVPWDAFQQSRHAAFQASLSSYVVSDGLDLTLSKHPVLAAIDASPAGLNFGVRDLNEGIRTHPDYTAERYIDAILEGVATNRSFFPLHQGYLAFFGFDDRLTEPAVDQQLLAELGARYNGEDQLSLAFFAENLSDIGPTSDGPSGGIGSNLAAWVDQGGEVLMQALDSWQVHRTDRDPQLASLNPATGIELAFNDFGTRFFELYVADLDAAVEGEVDANGNSLLLGLTEWNEWLTGEGLTGDYNSDGVVDAADYTVWRDGLGGPYTIDDYELWRQNFGRVSTSETGSMTTPVPEGPVAAYTLVAIAGLLGSSYRRPS